MGMIPRKRGGKKTPKGEKLNLSKTQFITYISCGKQYYYKYHRGYREPSDKEPFLKGNAIHDFWEHMYTDYCTVDEENCEIKITGELSQKQKQYYKMLKNIVEFEQKRMKKVKQKGLDLDKYFYPISQEERLEVNGMRGLPDAIYRREDGTLEVFDLKSSFYSSWKHEYEAYFYGKLVDMSNKFDAPVTAGTLFSASKKQLRYYRFNEYTMKEFEGMMEDARKGIKQGKFEPCGMNWCSWDESPPENAERKPGKVRK